MPWFSAQHPDLAGSRDPPGRDQGSTPGGSLGRLRLLRRDSASAADGLHIRAAAGSAKSLKERMPWLSQRVGSRRRCV